jgi:hypothetical protein
LQDISSPAAWLLLCIQLLWFRACSTDACRLLITLQTQTVQAAVQHPHGSYSMRQFTFPGRFLYRKACAFGADVNSAELLQPLAAACNTISAALEYHRQQQQQGATKHQQQQQQAAAEQQQRQQQQSLDIMMRLGYHLLHIWSEEVRNRIAKETAAVAAAAAAGGAGASRPDACIGEREFAAMHGWLFTDPAALGSTVVAAVIRLAMALVRTPGYGSCEASDIYSEVAPSSSGAISVSAALLLRPVTRLCQCAMVATVAEIFGSTLVACSNPNDVEMSVQLRKVVNQPCVLQLLLLDLAAAVQALHRQQNGKAALPDAAAAVAAALQQSASNAQQLQQQLGRGQVSAWHEQLLLRLGVPAGELAAASEAYCASDAPHLSRGRPVLVLGIAFTQLALPAAERAMNNAAEQQQQQQQQQDELQAGSCGSSGSSSSGSSGSRSSGSSSSEDQAEGVKLPNDLQLPLLWTLLELLLLFDTSWKDAAYMLGRVVYVMVEAAQDLRNVHLHAVDENASGKENAAADNARVHDASALLAAVLQLQPVLLAAAAAHSKAAGVPAAADAEGIDTSLLSGFMELVCMLAAFINDVAGKQ